MLRRPEGHARGRRSRRSRAASSDPSCRCEAHHAMGGTLLSMGELDASRHHFEAALAAYDERHPQRSALGSDLGVFAHAWYSHTLWLLGDDERCGVARRAGRRAGAAARSRVQPGARARVRRPAPPDAPRCRTRCSTCAEAVVALCERYGFAYYGDWAHVLIGWARGLERPAEGVEMIESALDRLDATPRAGATAVLSVAARRDV